MSKIVAKLIKKRQKGQTMSVVALLLGLGVLVGLVALAIDGGSVYLQRRFMQNSSDAGSLAGVQLMSQRVLITGGDPGYPTYALTTTLLLDTVMGLAEQNRGGAIGATNSDYTVRVYYHYAESHPSYGGTFGPEPLDEMAREPEDPDYYVRDHVDGIKVVSTINNPTVFARALPSPIQNLPVSAAAAMAIFPTCRPQPPGGPGTTLPFTRFRYSFEQELPTKGNDLCSPFIYWNAQADISGPGNNNFKNKISFNTRSFFMDENPSNTDPDVEQQLLSGFDHRFGAQVPYEPGDETVDMRGRVDPNDQTSAEDIDWWIRYQWQGAIMTNTNWLSDPNALGDWSEIYLGNYGQNVQDPLVYLIKYADDGGYTPISADWPEGLGWGRAITRTVYLWGEGGLEPGDTTATSAQKSREVCINPLNGNTCSCNNPNCVRDRVEWDYIDIDAYIAGNGDPMGDAAAAIERVRYTDAVQVVFYEHLNGGGGDARCPDGTGVPSSNNSSEARGILPSANVGGPPPGPPGSGCPPGWIPGAGVYYRTINP